MILDHSLTTRLALVAGLVAISSSAMAQLTFDATSGNNQVDNGDGDWSTAISDWTSDGGVNNVVWTNGENAIFGGAGTNGAAGTVTVNTVTVGTAGGSQILFDAVSGDYTLTGGTINFAATGGASTAITLESDTTINSTLTQSGGLAGFLTGSSATLTLGGANTGFDPTTHEILGDVTVVANHNDALGGASTVLLTGQGATLELGDGVSLANPVDFVDDTNETKAVSVGDGNTATLSGGVTIAEDQALRSVFQTGAGGTLTVSGDISGNSDGGITTQGDGTTILTGNNTYDGQTDVIKGTLLINGDNSGATGNVTVINGATLGGSGTVGGSTTINGLHTPGNSPGIQYFDNGLSYGATGVMEWELVNNTVSGPGVNFDRIMVDGGLSFDASTTIQLDFNSPDGSGVDWNDDFWGLYNIREWQLFGVTSGTTTGFSTSLLEDSSNWFDSASTGSGSLAFDTAVGNGTLPSSATFYLFQSGESIYLRYEALPEPTTFGLLGMVLAAVTGLARPKRRLQ